MSVLMSQKDKDNMHYIDIIISLEIGEIINEYSSNVIPEKDDVIIYDRKQYEVIERRIDIDENHIDIIVKER